MVSVDLCKQRWTVLSVLSTVDVSALYYLLWDLHILLITDGLCDQCGPRKTCLPSTVYNGLCRCLQAPMDCVVGALYSWQVMPSSMGSAHISENQLHRFTASSFRYTKDGYTLYFLLQALNIF